jgi:hypothetical protein
MILGGIDTSIGTSGIIAKPADNQHPIGPFQGLVHTVSAAWPCFYSLQ